ncbi:MAG: hypothetical protein AAGJ81_07475 [Verrucomicrobiota bacterium]
MSKWISELKLLLEHLFGSPFGSTPFWITSGIALGTLLILGWLIASFIFSAKRGFILTFFALVLPGVAALAGSIAVNIYAVPALSAGPVREYLPIAGAVLGGFLATLILTRFMLGISEGSTVLCTIMSYACVTGAVFLGGSLVTEADSSIDNLERQSEEREKDANSILEF